MMKLLTPLGLLGLIGIIILIIIYLLKPNYQQKAISSTFVWKLSLKYRKKRLPINRFRNLLILICQILIISSIALILAQPFIPGEKVDYAEEKIIVLDGSASMLAIDNGETRFERAVEEIRLTGTQLLVDGGTLSLILADDSSDYVVTHPESINVLNALLDELINAKSFACTYGTGDVDGAMKLAESALLLNPKAEIVFYTDKQILDHGIVNVQDVSTETERNAAILDCKVTTVDNYYVFDVEAASYGMDKNMVIKLTIQNYNDTGKVQEFTLSPENLFLDGQSQHVVFDSTGTYLYDSVKISVAEDDAFSHDNTYYVYGGTKEVLDIQYCSSGETSINPFVGSALLAVQDVYRGVWNFNINEVSKLADAKLSGYDFYIFEHSMPDVLPTDGVVLLLDPDKAPAGAGFTMGSVINDYFTFAGGESHPLSENVNYKNMYVNSYPRILAHDGYDEIMYCGGDPIYLAKNEEDFKVAVLALNVHQSSPGIMPDLSIIFYNLFEYYLPSTVSGNVFAVGEEISLRARGAELNVSGPDYKETFDAFPAITTAITPGVYTLTQKVISGETVTENFYVQVANSESDFTAPVEKIASPEPIEIEEPENTDLLIIFASILVALLFIEWWLQSQAQS